MRGKRLKQDVVVSAVFAAARIVVLLGLVRAAGDVLTAAMLGAFLLSRRLASTGSNLFQFGASQTLRRYISMHAGDRKVKFSFFVVAMSGWIALCLIVVPILYASRTPLSHWLFPGVPEAAGLAFWTGIQTLALILGFIVFSTLIAERKIATGNALDTLAAGGFLIPVLLVEGFARTPTELVRFHSLAVIGSCLIVGAWYSWNSWPGNIPERSQFESTLGEFRRYGMPRTIVTFLDMAILLVGPWLLRSQPEEAGYLIIALTLTRAIQAAMLPLTQIASVVTARLTGAKDETALDEGIKILFGTLLYSSTILAAFLVPWRDILLRLWLGNAVLESGVRYYFDALMWAIVPFAVFQGLKGVIEMRWFRARNVYSLLAAFVAYFATHQLVSVISEGRNAARISTVIAFVVLGVCTILWCRSYLRPFLYWGIVQLAIASLLIVSVNTTAAHYGGVPHFLLAAGVSAIVVCALFIFRPAPYIRALHSFLLPGRKVPSMST